tara:strand:- start:398 stop:622 length:225 start_codon:yes stop_codon:yes gene_type:complete
MNELEKRFGWRLLRISRQIKQENYEKAFDEYSVLVNYFKRINYNEHEKAEFYSKIKSIGDELTLILIKRKLKNG